MVCAAAGVRCGIAREVDGLLVQHRRRIHAQGDQDGREIPIAGLEVRRGTEGQETRMTCPTCDDRGMVRVNWKDADEDYAVCLCAVGERLRRTTNHGKPCLPGWRVWAAQQGVDPTRVVMIEDVLTSEEL